MVVAGFSSTIAHPDVGFLMRPASYGAYRLLRSARVSHSMNPTKNGKYDVKSPEQLLNYWFQDNRGRDSVEDNGSNLENYTTLKSKMFGDTLSACIEGYLSRWLRTKNGTLAYIILTDQFPRHIYRGHEASFAFDPLALSAAKRAVQHFGIETFKSTEVTFILLPFMHSEELKDHIQGINIMNYVLRRRPADQRLILALASMIANKSIVEKFGRIPTRNKVLGRLSTEEEQIYLLSLRGVPVDLTFFNYLGGKMAKDETDLSVFFYLGGRMSSQGYGAKRDEVSHDAM